ncbi:MAG: sulfite exporter TauE/SafE family protein [Phycisphaerae bacterium]
MWTLRDSIVLALVGLLAGWLGGLMGVGGSVIMIPALAMLWGGARQHLYQAAAMIVNVCVVAPAVWRHARAGATVRRVLEWTIPTATLGSLAGVYLSNRRVFHGPGQGFLQIIFGVFLCYVVVYNLVRLRSSQPLPDLGDAEARALPPWKLVSLVGLPAGLIGGLLGIGGGALAVPCQQLFLRMPLRRAIANSAAIILLSSLVGAIAKNLTLAAHGYSVFDSIHIAALLAPTGFAGSYVGAAQVHRWPRRLLRLIFVCFMSYAAAHLLVTGWRSVRGLR